MPTPDVSMPPFFSQPKHDHHVQIMVLCIILGIVVLAGWLYTTLATPTVPEAVTVTAPPKPNPLLVARQEMLARLRAAPVPSASDIQEAVIRLSKAKKATTADTQEAVRQLQSPPPAQ